MNPYALTFRLFCVVFIGLHTASQAQIPSTIKVDFANFLLQNTQQVDIYSMDAEWLDTKKVLRLPEMALFYNRFECPNHTSEFDEEIPEKTSVIIPYNLFYIKDKGIRLQAETIVANFSLEIDIPNEKALRIDELELHFKAKNEAFEVFAVKDPSQKENWFKQQGYWQAEQRFKQMVSYRQMMAFFDCYDNIAEFQRYFSSFRFPDVKSVRHFFSLNSSAKPMFIRDEEAIELWKTDESPSFDTNYVIHFKGDIVQSSFLRVVDEAIDTLLIDFQVVDHQVKIVGIVGSKSAAWKNEKDTWIPQKHQTTQTADANSFEVYLKSLAVEKEEGEFYLHPEWSSQMTVMDDAGVPLDILVPQHFELWPEATALCRGTNCFFPARSLNEQGEAALYTLVFSANGEGFDLLSIIDGLGREIALNKLD